MAYSIGVQRWGLENTISPLISVGHVPATTSSSKSACGAVVRLRGVGMVPSCHDPVSSSC